MILSLSLFGLVLCVIFLIFLCAEVCYFIHGKKSASRVVVVVVVVVSTYYDIAKDCSSRRNGGERRKKASKKTKEKKETVLLMILQQQQLVSLFMSADCGLLACLLADWLAGWMLAGCWLLLQLSKIVDASPRLSPSAPCEGDKRLSLVKPFPCCIHVLFSALFCFFLSVTTSVFSVCGQLAVLCLCLYVCVCARARAMIL